MTKNYKITISYEGTHYCGWQVQTNQISIQEKIQCAMDVILRKKELLVGAGRTDSGVHAHNQVAHFQVEEELDQRVFLKSMNGLLPPDIRIIKIEEVPLTFHSRYSSKRKIYHYHICTTKFVSPFRHLYCCHNPKVQDIELLKEAAKYFIGEHDFTSFTNSAAEGSAAINPVRTIYRLDVVEEKDGIRLEFEGNGFLYKMVRNISGTLIEIALGRLSVQEIPGIFESKNRSNSGRAAPAKGLFLADIKY